MFSLASLAGFFKGLDHYRFYDASLSNLNNSVLFNHFVEIPYPGKRKQSISKSKSPLLSL